MRWLLREKPHTQPHTLINLAYPRPNGINQALFLAFAYVTEGAIHQAQRLQGLYIVFFDILSDLLYLLISDREKGAAASAAPGAVLIFIIHRQSPPSCSCCSHLTRPSLQFPLQLSSGGQILESLQLIMYIQSKDTTRANSSSVISISFHIIHCLFVINNHHPAS